MPHIITSPASGSEVMQSVCLYYNVTCNNVDNSFWPITSRRQVAGSPPNLRTMDSRSACIQVVLKVEVKVKGHVIRALLCWLLFIFAGNNASSALSGYVKLFIIRVKFAIYYFLHFNKVRQVATRLRAKSVIYDCLVRLRKYTKFIIHNQSQIKDFQWIETYGAFVTFMISLCRI